jgi:TonB family protein
MPPPTVGWMNPLRLPAAVFLASSALLSAADSPAVSAAYKDLSGPPMVESWTPPVYPPALEASNVQGKAVVQFVVDEKGAISRAHLVKATAPAFGEAALAAVEKWICTPALEEGKPVVSCVTTQLVFKLPYHPSKVGLPQESQLHFAKKTAAVAEDMALPPYPPSLEPRQLNGEVLFEVALDAEGKVLGIKLVAANNPGFVKIARDAVAAWKFQPARQGDLPVKSSVSVPVHYSLWAPAFAEGIPTQLAANGFALRPSAGESAQHLCDRPPEIWAMADPVYPFELLSSGQSGEAKVDFTVNSQGNVEDIAVRSASQPALAQSVVAALEATNFKPALREGRTVAVPLTRKFSVGPPPEVAADNEPEDAALIRRIKAGEVIPSPKDLDAKLKPLWRLPPQYPQALRAEGAAGSAEIEFILDREGRCRLPRIISATREEFGWAAATAVSLWVFEPPLKGGQPIDIRIRVSLNFPAPSQS